MPKGDKLTPKQEKFCTEYLVDLNAKQAAIRAGYSPRTAKAIGYENLTKPYLKQIIEKSQAALREAAIEDGDIATPEEALVACTQDMRFDPAEMFDDSGTMLEIREMPEHVRLSLCGHKTKERIERSEDKEEVLSRWTDIKYPDKVRCRDQLLKTLGVIKGGNGNGININDAENVQIIITTAPLKKALADAG